MSLHVQPCLPLSIFSSIVSSLHQPCALFHAHLPNPTPQFFMCCFPKKAIAEIPTLMHPSHQVSSFIFVCKIVKAMEMHGIYKRSTPIIFNCLLSLFISNILKLIRERNVLFILYITFIIFDNSLHKLYTQ